MQKIQQKQQRIREEKTSPALIFSMTGGPPSQILASQVLANLFQCFHSLVVPSGNTDIRHLNK